MVVYYWDADTQEIRKITCDEIAQRGRIYFICMKELVILEIPSNCFIGAKVNNA